MRLKCIIVICYICFFIGCSSDLPVEIAQTPFEISEGKRTATYDETLDFCHNVYTQSFKVQLQIIGRSSQGYKIPMLIIDNNKNFTVDKVRKSKNAVLLIQANVHPGEPDGNDAGMLLIKEMLASDIFPANITILFIPIVNPDGLNRFGAYNRINQNGPEKMGWRTNAQHLNINRDFMKADAPETQAWLKIFNTWMPDFTMDIHVTDGADYQYVLTYIMETLGNMDSVQTEWQNKYIENVINTKMLTAGFPMFPYVTFKKWHDPRSGLYMRPSSPMLSSGYLTLHNRPMILVEAHSLKPFKQRVEAIFYLMKETIAYLDNEYQTLLEANHLSDSLVLQLPRLNQQYPLSYLLTDKCDTINFLGVDYDIIKSDLTNGDWFQYKPDSPRTFQIPMYKTIEPADFVEIPAAYIIGPEWGPLIQRRLDLHGIKHKTISEDIDININTYVMNNPSWNKTPHEGRFMLNDVELTQISQNQHLIPGAIVIPTNQRRVKLIMNMFDPHSANSFLKYGFFNAIFEQSEYFETYVMEPMARKMLDTIPELKERFNAWKKSQPQQPTAYEQLYWFYQQTPYYDSKKNIYPVFSIDDQSLENIKPYMNNKILIN